MIDWIKRLFVKEIQVMEDPALIQAKIDYLNATYQPGPWVAADRYHAFTVFDFNNGNYVFNPSAGIPVKVFMNTITGEYKMFPAVQFER